nr:oxysterol-binding protein 1 isoform X1 [Onthophagus taurus]
MGDGAPAKGVQNEPAMKGWLFKWTNYLKGYQRRWFVLQNGLLSYYRAENNSGGVTTLSLRRRRRFRNGNQAEMAHTCRGSISLHGALIHTVDHCTFVISNGGTQTFHIRAASEIERQSWVTALELAKARAIRNLESEEEEEETEDGASPEEWANVVRELQAKLDDLKTCSDLISKHGGALQRALGELEVTAESDTIQGKHKAVQERATLFRIASNAMMNACSEYLSMALNHGHKWTRLLQHEREQRQRLQEMVETLAQQHSKLEQAAAANAQRPRDVISGSEDEDENEFYDAVAEGGNNLLPVTSSGSSSDHRFLIDIPNPPHNRQQQQQELGGSDEAATSSDASSSEETEETGGQQAVVVTHGKTDSSPLTVERKDGTAAASSSGSSGGKKSGARARRNRVPDKPNYPISLWSIVKNCIGKDLTKIPIPVNFSEPLSMLQRLTEDFEYSEILDKAGNITDPCEQLAYVAAFTISSYSTTSSRNGKPFNPLLGETYEFDRMADLGWRVINEQVSHHPPMVAQYCEGRGWKCWQEFSMSSKFRGKYLQIVPLGIAYVEFDNGNRYSWRKVTTTIHNIIVGKLWVDHHGDMDIIGRGSATGSTCHLKYVPYSYFTKESQRRVKGAVMDSAGEVKWIVNGTWDGKVEICKVTGNSSGNAQNNPVYETAAPLTAWKRRMPDAEAEKYYNFTELACQLNELEDGVAPTDSRLRPDQRLMEEQDWDKANQEKVRLEEKQRAVRRKREADAEKAQQSGIPVEPYEPIWFRQVKDEDTGTFIHVYKGEYWGCKQKQDWSRCPDIF